MLLQIENGFYGLRRFPHLWFNKFSHAMLKFGCIKSTADYMQFFSEKCWNSFFFIVYMHDTVVAGYDLDAI